eukprot:Plantae.Rhodophyta-Purpureofilum_apyrenoidigerum.ctg3159.p2 GENE.Plantae.Rhodophyta-Purpureofilum_apyrenoidigerum.ctg3159~~Plantae.Rhodophyta-Purpureofilum_apyrenoidigerum.ctg3159.p2  ORF type:complete len:119 (+),score=24.68 Plantae.Rhodophyta-Purpureofilum_apyrenoidigerum.ctg3159:412-768(+)
MAQMQAVGPEDVPVEYSCLICLDVLYKPVRLDCSHLLCKPCSVRAWSYSLNCPLCRTEKVLKRFLKPDMILHEMLKAKFPKNMQRRKIEHHSEARSGIGGIRKFIKGTLEPGSRKLML